MIAGLQRLEYRGYDSAGIAVDGIEGKIAVFKEVGPVANLLKLVNEHTEDPVRPYLLSSVRLTLRSFANALLVIHLQ